MVVSALITLSVPARLGRCTGLLLDRRFAEDLRPHSSCASSMSARANQRRHSVRQVRRL